MVEVVVLVMVEVVVLVMVEVVVLVMVGGGGIGDGWRWWYW